MSFFCVKGRVLFCFLITSFGSFSDYVVRFLFYATGTAPVTEKNLKVEESLREMGEVKKGKNAFKSGKPNRMRRNNRKG